MATQHLEQSRRSPHSYHTCGQSRGGGFRTSDSRRRSNSFGRVAVAHVQGLPKGGGVLGLLGILNTRLGPVPPLQGEARLRLGDRSTKLRVGGHCAPYLSWREVRHG